MAGLFDKQSGSDPMAETMRSVASLLKAEPAPMPEIVKMLPDDIAKAAKKHGIARHGIESVYFPRGNQVFWPVGVEPKDNPSLLAHELAHAVQNHNKRPLDEREADWVGRKIKAWPEGR